MATNSSGDEGHGSNVSNSQFSYYDASDTGHNDFLIRGFFIRCEHCDIGDDRRFGPSRPLYFTDQYGENHRMDFERDAIIDSISYEDGLMCLHVKIANNIDVIDANAIPEIDNTDENTEPGTGIFFDQETTIHAVHCPRDWAWIRDYSSDDRHFGPNKPLNFLDQEGGIHTISFRCETIVEHILFDAIEPDHLMVLYTENSDAFRPLFEEDIHFNTK